MSTSDSEYGSRAAQVGAEYPTRDTWTFAELFNEENPAATEAREAGKQFGATPVSRGAASTLTVLAKAINARAVVEVGSGAGVSGLALFAGMQPDGILTSVDIEPEHQNAARQAFRSVGIPNQRFRLIAGAALNVLPKLSDGAYDMVLIDADKLEYPEYVEQALRLLRHGGLLVIDNTLWHNRTADQGNNDDETEAIRQAVRDVRENEGLVSTLVPTGDGLLISVKL
ncbi:O-methyltransferase [Microlunatus sp. Gsoil 973]|uniref:O-methyltransferase n=1 Tax=Microlunatus sp. Gsoil 973 TaxID=2672569 RepID=UPI001E382118|nr:O-methyltransferase [Microlunatus sp. Gsoil 973]